MTRLFFNVGVAVLVIEQTAEGFFLYTFRPNALASDTWHQTLEEAKDQANYEWPGMRIDWRPVPDNVGDLPAFARQNSN
jgi:hypothetical protein